MCESEVFTSMELGFYVIPKFLINQHGLNFSGISFHRPNVETKLMIQWLS